MAKTALLALPFVVTAGAIAAAFRPENAGKPLFLALILGPSLLLAAFAAYRANEDGELREWVQPKWGDFSGGAATALALFAVAYATTKVLTPPGTPKVEWLRRLYEQMGASEVLRQRAALVAVAIILFAILDALVWRGLVPALLAERFGSRTAWIWSGALYGLAYVPAAFVLRDAALGPNWMLVAIGLATGWILGAVTRYFRRLVPGMVGHALFAWFALMTFRFVSPSV